MVKVGGSAGRPESPGFSAYGLPYKFPERSWAWSCPSPPLCSQQQCSRCFHWTSWCSLVVHESHCCHGFHNHWSPCCGRAEEKKTVKGSDKCLPCASWSLVCVCLLGVAVCGSARLFPGCQNPSSSLHGILTPHLFFRFTLSCTHSIRD